MFIFIKIKNADNCNVLKSFQVLSGLEVSDVLHAQVKLHEKIYGKSTLSKTSTADNQIIESAAMLNIQQQKEKAAKKKKEAETEGEERKAGEEGLKKAFQLLATPTVNDGDSPVKVRPLLTTVTHLSRYAHCY